MKRVLILASGEGTTCEYLLKLVETKALNLQVDSVVVDRVCGAIDVAKKFSVPCAIIQPVKGIDRKYWDQKLLQFLKAAKPDYIILLGFLRQISPSIVQTFPQRIINTHPSLLPAYGGKGMYGLRIHQKVLANKEKTTGITIHYVDENYDSGKIIAQKELAVKSTETPEALERRVKKIEKEFLFETLQKILN
ncbi:MAG: phosphoribosylglycinamide formyltransferase [Bdellovibrionales bacterium]|nr:phosphoribosylglycinamide formyltransferase [Bdellovibrionales bacterium]